MNELDIPSIILAKIEETRVRVVEHHTNENETKQQMKKSRDYLLPNINIWSLFPSCTNRIAEAENAVATDANDKNARLSNVVLSMTSPAYVCTIKAV